LRPLEEVKMRFCFIVEEQYRNDPMPMVVADQLLQWGHAVDILEPQDAVTCLSDLARVRSDHAFAKGAGDDTHLQALQVYDAYVLKSLADGPGMSILEAAEAVGIPTINNARAIRLVRDKAVAVAFARAHGLPIPPTYFVAHPRLLKQIPAEEYPLVVKPSNGSSCKGIYRLNSPTDLTALELAEANDSFFLAQRYAENTGFDIKIYVTGNEVYAALAKKSPLHSDVEEKFVPLTPQLRKLALQVGKIFGLDIYGIDVVETPQGLAVVDINDFPSFGRVPRAVVRVSEYVLHAAKRAERQRLARMERKLQRQKRQNQEMNTSTAQELPDSNNLQAVGQDTLPSDLPAAI
jgi:ribosomal protein S6--L-glutamate ligase